MHVTNFLKGGGRLFVSGSEIAWDLDYKANGENTYKNGSSNDRTFYNQYLRASYVSDDASTYHVSGAIGSIFNELDFNFDDGNHGTYDVQYPDTINTYDGATTIGLNYEGGANACVYASSPTSGTVVNMAFPFETIYPDSARLNIMKAILNYFDLPVVAPTMKSVLCSGADSVVITWTGHAQLGFRLFRKTGSGSWTPIQDELSLGTDAQSATITGLSSLTPYAFKIQAVNTGGASPDSDVMVCSLPHELSDKILIVDGFDRYNSQHGGANHTLLENFADALANYSYDSCTNECIADGSVLLTDYAIVMWMCGEESIESETFSKTEQLKVQDFLKNGGSLFVSGAEIGWDLVHDADTNNNYSNGDPNDTPFYENYLKASFLNDDANTSQVRGVSGTPFDGLSFYFDDGKYGTYNVEYPDVIATNGESMAALYYGAFGTNVAGVMFTGTVTGGSADAKIINFGFPFETIYDATTRSSVMTDVLNYFTTTEVKDWSLYIGR
jgi:hypothetical protein